MVQPGPFLNSSRPARLRADMYVMAFINYLAFSSAVGTRLRPLIALMFLSAALFGYKFSETVFEFILGFSLGYLQGIILSGIAPVACLLLLLPTLVFYSKEDSADIYMLMCYWFSMPVTFSIYTYLMWTQIFQAPLPTQIGMMFSYTYYLNTIVHSLSKEREESVINSIYSLLILFGGFICCGVLFLPAFFKIHHGDFIENFGHAYPANPNFRDLLHGYNGVMGWLLFTSAFHIIAVTEFFRMRQRGEPVAKERRELREPTSHNHRVAG